MKMNKSGFWVLGVAFLFSCAKEEVKKPSAVEKTKTEKVVVEKCEARDALHVLDQRTPVPLQPMMAWHQKQNMMGHLVAIQGITSALADENWEAIAKASASIESSPQMAQMCKHMGSGAPGFTELALDFHSRADQIGVAAKSKDGKAVLKATAHTLNACTTCHSTYRQDVMTATDWESKTGSSHDPTTMPH